MVDENFLHKVVEHHVGGNKTVFDKGMLAYILTEHAMSFATPIDKIERALNEEFNRIGYKVHITKVHITREREKYPGYKFHVIFIPGDPDYIKDMPAGILDL